MITQRKKERPKSKNGITSLPPVRLLSFKPSGHTMLLLGFGENFQTTVPATKSITTWQSSSLIHSSEICKCWHQPAFQPVTIRTTFPRFSLMVSRPAAVPEDVHPPQEHSPSKLQAIFISSVAELFQLDSSGLLPAILPVQPGGPATLRLQPEMVFWISPCPSVCSWSACCTCRPPTVASLLIYHLGLIYPCSRQRCLVAVALWVCLRIGPSFPDGMLPCFWGFSSIPGPSGFQLKCNVGAGSTHCCRSAWPDAALALAAGGTLYEIRPVSHWRLPLSSHHVSAGGLSSRLAGEERARVSTLWRRQPQHVRCPECCAKTSIHFCVSTLLRLPLSHHLSAIHLSTTSRPQLSFWLLSLLPSAVRCIWLQWCRPVWWSWQLVFRQGLARSHHQLSCDAEGHSWLLFILVHWKTGCCVSHLAY